MKLSLEPINITKELILNHVSEEQIMEHYLGIKIQKGLFRSPLRNDHTPTCGFYRNKRGRLIMKDFSGAFSGDCFSVVMEKFKCSYYMALQIVANDFGIIHRKDLQVNKALVDYSGIKFEEQNPAKIQVKIREFNQDELDWWATYGITKETLRKYRIYPIDAIWLNDNLFYQRINDKRFIFGYYGGTVDGLEYWRIYWPNNSNRCKFISNWTRSKIQGVHLLPKTGKYVVVTKSLKDCAALYEFGIPAIAPCSENLFISNAQYNRLKERFDKVFLLYDLDIPGIQASKKIKKEFPDINVLLMPWHTAKDFSDYRKKFGYDKTLNLINKVKEYYGET